MSQRRKSNASLRRVHFHGDAARRRSEMFHAISDVSLAEHGEEIHVETESSVVKTKCGHKDENFYPFSCDQWVKDGWES